MVQQRHGSDVASSCVTGSSDVIVVMRRCQVYDAALISAAPIMQMQHACILSLIKLKNYVFELNGFTSVSHDFGSRKIFLLLNDSSHDPHFSACQNIKTRDRIQKISNFSLHRFSRYRTPNMALQNIILTFFFLLPDRGLCVLRAITSRRYWAIGTKFRWRAQGWM